MNGLIFVFLIIVPISIEQQVDDANLDIEIKKLERSKIELSEELETVKANLELKLKLIAEHERTLALRKSDAAALNREIEGLKEKLKKCKIDLDNCNKTVVVPTTSTSGGFSDAIKNVIEFKKNLISCFFSKPSFSRANTTRANVTLSQRLYDLINKKRQMLTAGSQNRLQQSNTNVMQRSPVDINSMARPMRTLFGIPT